LAGSNWDFSEFADRSAESEKVDSSQRTESGSAGGRAPAQPAPAPAPDYAFNSETATQFSLAEPGRPPTAWLAGCAVVTIVAGLVAAFWGDEPRWAVLAWVAGGPIAIGLLATFTAFDTRARAKPIYSAAGWVRPAYVGCLVLCGIAVCLSALRIALWVGRL